MEFNWYNIIIRFILKAYENIEIMNLRKEIHMQKIIPHLWYDTEAKSSHVLY